MTCLAISENGERPIVVAGIRQNHYGSRVYDYEIICYDLGTGDELWTRSGKEAGDLRGWKSPDSLGFDRSGNLFVGWDYLAVNEGVDYEIVSKLSVKNGAVIWDWAGPTGTDYSHGASIACLGSDVLVKTVQSVDSSGGDPKMIESYSVLDPGTGRPVAGQAASSASLETRWHTHANSLTFTESDGTEVIWGVHGIERFETNWLRWHKEDGLIHPESRHEKIERIQVTRIPPHGLGVREQFFVGGDDERVLSLLYRDGESRPTAAFLIDVSAEAELRKWRVVEITIDYKFGRLLAQGSGVSHNYDGPIRLTNSGSVVISGSLLHDQNPQKITCWK
ncbi:hypothetical protein V2O64_05725 [Verrucomicrobiaceae bacterium 227]